MISYKRKQLCIAERLDKCTSLVFSQKTIVTLENGWHFRILPNKKAFNQSEYRTPRSVKKKKPSRIKRPIIHLLTSKVSAFLNCKILFPFGYVMLVFIKLMQKSKRLNLLSLHRDARVHCGGE